MNETVNLTDRKNFIGASDCAAVLGLSRYKTQLQIWGEKTGLIEPEDISGKLYVKLGNKLEQSVAELFEEETGKKVHRVNDAYIHKKYPFIVCHIDRKVEGEKAILQCKTASIRKSDDWDDDEMPLDYILQEHHELSCTGYDRAYIACLIGNEKLEIRTIERDDKIINDIVKKEVEFWNKFVIPKIMPLKVTARDGDVLYKLYPNEIEGKEINLDDEAARLVENLQSLNTDYKTLKGLIEKQKNELKLKLKDAEIGLVGKYKITWKEQTKPECTTKASTFRVLRISEIKEEK